MNARSVDEEAAGWLEEVRPGRTLFLRKRRLGNFTRTTVSGAVTDTPQEQQPHADRPVLQLLCVHGLCATEQQFHPVCDHLHKQLLLQGNESSSSNNNNDNSKGKSFLVILYDQMGCGQSPVIHKDWDAYEKSESIADCCSIVQKYVDPTIPLIVMGHSYGSHIVWPALQRLRDCSNTSKNFPFSLLACIHISTCIKTIRHPVTPIPDGGVVLLKVLPVTVLDCLQPLLTRAFAKQALHGDNYAQFAPLLTAESNRNDMYMAKAYHGHLRWCHESELLSMTSSTIPPHHSLVIHGVQDSILPVSCGQELHNVLLLQQQQQQQREKRIQEFVAVERASHMVLLEQSEQVAKTILDFCTRIVTMKPAL